ncbi:MAG: transglutaminase-like cysteine peptidase [Alphaproteobacteria bacterium]|nr:transglutaminase-like cysteine peptidase [Alphaproteobacteria bacterium]
MIRGLESLKNKFRAAALSAMTAAGLLTGCDQQHRHPDATSAPNTQLVFDNGRVYTTLDDNEVQAWEPRQNSCLRNDSNQVHYQDWLSQLDDTKDASLLDKANAVNDLVNNQVTYLSDEEDYQAYEYFASGVETCLRGAGDCEDFAIAKLYAMKYLNVPENRTLLLFVATDGVSEQVNHCVLAVDTTADNSWVDCLILNDSEGAQNSIENLYETGYKPIFTMNTQKERNCKLKPLKQPAP